MKIGNAKNITREQVGKDAPGWVDALLGAINASLSIVFTALQGQLSAKHNLNAETRELEIVSDQEEQIPLLTLRGRPTHCVVSEVIEPVGTFHPRITWSPSATRQRAIDLTLSFDDPGTYKVRLRIEGD